MSIEIFNQTKAKINSALVADVAKAFLTVYKKSKFEVAIIFVTDREIRRINKVYRHRDKVTDVLSFAESDGLMPAKNFLGQIFIDYRQIKRQAVEFKHGADDELIFILVHGLLHLLGYDDRTEAEAKIMVDLGNKFIAKFMSAKSK